MDLSSKTGCIRNSLLSAALWFVCYSVQAAQVCWVNPTENVDGTALTDLTLVSLHWGEDSRNYTGQADYPTDIPGDNICADIPLPPGDWYVAATAVDADDNRSAYSNEIIKAGDAGPSPPIVVNAPAQLNAELVDVSTLIGETGVDVLFTWSGGESDTEIQLVEYGKDTAILTGRTASNTWTFVPTRAGLYEVKLRECVDDVCGQWYRSSDLGYMFFFNLAAPTGGGID